MKISSVGRLNSIALLFLCAFAGAAPPIHGVNSDNQEHPLTSNFRPSTSIPKDVLVIPPLSLGVSVFRSPESSRAHTQPSLGVHATFLLSPLKFFQQALFQSLGALSASMSSSSWPFLASSKGVFHPTNAFLLSLGSAQGSNGTSFATRKDTSSSLLAEESTRKSASSSEPEVSTIVSDVVDDTWFTRPSENLSASTRDHLEGQEAEDGVQGSVTEANNQTIATNTTLVMMPLVNFEENDIVKRAAYRENQASATAVGGEIYDGSAVHTFSLKRENRTENGIMIIVMDTPPIYKQMFYKALNNLGTMIHWFFR